MTINAIEDAIIAHLTRVMQNVKVQSFPQKPQDYVLQAAKAAILIRFVEEKPKLEVMDRAGENDLHFDISIIARDFKSQTGVYDFYESVKKALNYIQFGEDAGIAKGLLVRFRGGRYDSYDVQKGLWYYAQRYSVSVPFTPQPTPAVLVTQIILADVSYYPDNLDNPDITIIP